MPLHSTNKGTIAFSRVIFGYEMSCLPVKMLDPDGRVEISIMPSFAGNYLIK